MRTTRRVSKKAAGGWRRFRRSDYPGEQESVRCKLCRREFRAISITHVRYLHGIDLDEYVERFPSANIASAVTRQRLSDRVRDRFNRQGRYWTKTRVKYELLRRRRQRKPVNAQTVYHEARDLYEAAYSLFRSWDGALRAGGLRPENVRRNRKWDAHEVLREIRKIHRAGQLTYGAKLLRRRPELVQAAVKAFGSWRVALAKAGLEALAPAPTHWTRREVAARIRRRAARGESLSSAQVVRHETALWMAARRLFAKPWCDLIRRLGYPYPGHESWNRRKVVRELRRLKQSSTKLNAATVRRQAPKLAYAAGQYFGTWEAACRAAGIPTEDASR